MKSWKKQISVLLRSCCFDRCFKYFFKNFIFLLKLKEVLKPKTGPRKETSETFCFENVSVKHFLFSFFPSSTIWGMEMNSQNFIFSESNHFCLENVLTEKCPSCPIESKSSEGLRAKESFTSSILVQFPCKLSETRDFQKVRDFIKPVGYPLTTCRAAPRAVGAPMPTIPGGRNQHHNPCRDHLSLACDQAARQLYPALPDYHSSLGVLGSPIKILRCQGKRASSWAPPALAARSTARHTRSRKEAFTACHWKRCSVIQWGAAFLQRAIKIPFGTAVALLPSHITLLFKEGASDTVKHTWTRRKPRELLNLKTTVILRDNAPSNTNIILRCR